MGERGPTQGAERHADALASGWTARPGLAALLRLLIVVLPLLISFGFSIGAGRIAPADELGMNRWLWIAIVFLLSTVLMIVLRRLTSRLIPLVALMKLTLVFPDNAPSRTKAALRRSNSRSMLRAIQDAAERGEDTGEVRHSDYLVQLLAEVNDHDRLTRGHSERVRAYAELLGAEIGLDADEMNKLRWASLLHDVGKLTVPWEILNKDGRPTDDEWEILSGHPAAGMPMLEPLRGWLGEWIHAADQHHCRWDGNGYPSELSGTDITLAGRLVAIADAYDVMTSARSYKKPLAPEVARQELTNCAGSQFDPNLVRAFLQIGLGRLKTIAGPLAWLSNLTGSAQLPIPAANAVSTGAWSVGVAATGIVTVGVTSVFSPPPLETIALDDPSVVAEDVTVAATAGRPFDVVISASGESLTFTVGDGAWGTATLAQFPEAVDGGWEATVRYEPSDTHVGEDGFSFEACDPDRRCDQGAVTLQLLEPSAALSTEPQTTATTSAPTTASTTSSTAPTSTTAPPTTGAAGNQPPSAEPDEATVAEDGTVRIDVLGNDRDAEGDELSLTGVGGPLRGVAAIDGNQIVYAPAADVSGSDQFSYTISDGTNPDVVSLVRVTIVAVDDPPIASPDNASTAEDSSVRIAVTGNDFDPEGDPLSAIAPVRSAEGGALSVVGGSVTYTPPADFAGIDRFDYVAADPAGNESAATTVTITVSQSNDAPETQDDGGVGFVTAEDTALTTADVRANDSDVDHAVTAATVELVGTAARGVVTSNGDGTFSYVPNQNLNGDDTFQYRLVDAAGQPSLAATVTITVTSENDPPEPADDTLSVATNGSATTVDLRLNDSDVDGDALTVTGASDGTHGTVTVTAAGTATYSHGGSSALTDSFTYTLRDPAGATATGTVVVTLTGAPDRDGVGVGDNCPNAYNPRQFDTDGDGTGDACDPTPTAASGGDFGNNGVSAGSFDAQAVAAVDFDGDGDIDAAFASSSGANRIYDNDAGALSDTGQRLGTADSRGLALGDFDGDGDIDFVFANQGATNSLWLNNGTGVFVGVSQTIGASDSWDAAAGDLDGDGDVDVVFAENGSGNTVWFNDGTGALTSSGPSLGSAPTKGVSVADLNGDSHLDLAFSNDGVGDTIWLNSGTGVFTDTGQSLGLGRSHTSALADLDGNGDIDMVIAGDDDGDSVWLNNGAGAFSQVGPTLGLGHSRAVDLGDADGDGDLDIVFGDHTGANTVWLNDGSALFTDSGNRMGNDATEGLVFVDLDGDGDLGVVSANDSDTNRVNGNS